MQNEHAKVIKFFAGLNESYAVIRSQIIMKKHVPDLFEIYNLLDQDHSQRNITPTQNASVNAAQSKYNPQETSRSICYGNQQI